MALPTRFALVGAAGYIAPRHLDAIASVGGELVAAFDPHDSVGVLDRYFPQSSFFTEYERFDRHLTKLALADKQIDYLVVCSPNHLHDAHCRLGLRLGADVICEKPLVLNTRNATALAAAERQFEGRINCILQARLHPSSQAIAASWRQGAPRVSIKLNYLTPRGAWYDYSWKGDVSRSGGVCTNIGIHLLDLLLLHFGAVETVTVHESVPRRMRASLRLQGADVDLLLSINADDLPEGVERLRSFEIDGKAIDFTQGFEDLHRRSYEAILQGQGFSIADALPAIQLAEQLR